MNMDLLFLILGNVDFGVVGPHEYPPSPHKHVHVVGGEDGDEIRKSGSERV